jgi:hypothetical protein
MSNEKFGFFVVKPYNTSISFNPRPAVIGGSVEIKCASKGVPPPHFIIILLNGQKINNMSHIIRNVSQSDEGKYTCVAINGLGNNTAIDTLNVTGEIKFLNAYLHLDVNQNIRNKNGNLVNK